MSNSLSSLSNADQIGSSAWKKLMAVFLALAVLLTLWPLAPASAQDGDDTTVSPQPAGRDLRFEHLTTQDGLSQGRVWGITQDSRGFMWFSTLEGLNRYDGYEFQVYRQERDNANSPGGTLFWKILEDRDGMIWAASVGGGLSRFDPTTEQWRRYQHDPGDPDSLGSNSVYSLLEDSAGVLWVGTEVGLNRFDGEAEDGQARFTRFEPDPNDPHSLGSGWMPSIYEDRSGVLWIGTSEGGLNRFDPQTETFTRYLHDPEDPDSLSYDFAFAIHEDQSGVLWVGTYGGGLNRFDPETETFARYQHNPQDPRSLSGDIVTDVLEDPSGTLWIATFDGGLNRYHPESDSFSSYQHDPLDARSLGGNALGSLFVDRSGTLWIGTVGNGISKLDPRQQGFALIQHNPGDTNSLSNNDVRAVFEDRSGDLWIGTYGGLNRYDPETGRYTRYLHDPADPTSLGDDRMHAIAEDSTGALWIGTDAHGLDRFDPDTETFFRIESDPANPDGLSDNIVLRLYADREGTLWIGTLSQGLDAFAPQSHDGQPRFTHYRHDPEDPHSLGQGLIASIFEDDAGVLWVGTGAGGACRLERDTEEQRTPGKFVCYRHDPQDADSLSDNTVWSILEDREGALWMGTGAGLNRLDPQTGKFLRYTTADGLPHGSVFGILEDEEGHLWLSTGRGLSQFDPQEISFQNYRASDGLQGDVFNQLAYHEASTGELFFGGANGLTSFYPDDIRDNAYIPPVHITGIQLANQPVAVGGDSPLQASVFDTEELALSHQDRMISFEFAALSFSSAEGNRYKYKLEGFEEDWHEVDSSRRFATYTNLDPGEYTFRVLGSNNSGVWNEEGDSLKLTITPPWWLTWWSRAGALLLLGGMAAVGFVWQWQSGKRRERHLAATVAGRTHELNERVKELDCLYGISRLAGQQGNSLEQILEGVVDLLPPAMQYPEITCARIVLDGREFKTDNFRETPWQQSSTLVVRGEQAGHVEVGLLEDRPDAGGGLFLEEEQLLLTAVAERLGRITERKRAEEELRESELRLDLAVAGSEGGLWSTDLGPDDPGHTLPDEIHLSSRLKGFLGYEDAEFPNSMAAWESHVHPEDLSRLRESSLKHLQGQLDQYELEYRIRHRDGSIRWLRTTGRVERDGDGRPVRFAGMDWDITDRKEAESALQRARDEMETLLEMSYDLSTVPELTGLLDHLLRHLSKVVDFQRAGVMLVDDEGVLTTRAFYAPDFANVTTVQIPISAVSAFRRIFDRREMVYIPDIQADEAALEAFGQVVSESWFAAVAGMRTWLGVPLLVRDRVIGILSLLHTEPDRYGAGTQNLLRLFANQLAIAIENVRLYARAQESAVFEERARLARDLHDSVTQTLYSTNLFADATSLALSADSIDTARGHLDSLRSLIWQAMLEMRMLISELRPPLLKEVGLAGALQTRLESVEARVGLSIDFRAEGERQLPSNVEADLYHVALEALNNIAKHAKAQQATVHLKMDEERCHLVIQDDGIGFDPEVASRSGGHGLRNMQERVAQIGGRLSLETAPGRGTTVTIEVNA